MTRVTPYLECKGLDRYDLLRRKPYFIIASSEAEAVQIMRDLFADDMAGFEGWLWQKNVTDDVDEENKT